MGHISLLGIFDVHMLLIYGEGLIWALRRPSEEIEKLSSINGQYKTAARVLKNQETNRWSGME